MPRKIIPLIVVILPLILVTVASALEVGNLKLLGAGKESRITIELQAEHLTRQMDLKEPCGITSSPVYIYPLTSSATGIKLTNLQETYLLQVLPDSPFFTFHLERR